MERVRKSLGQVPGYGIELSFEQGQAGFVYAIAESKYDDGSIAFSGKSSGRGTAMAALLDLLSDIVEFEIDETVTDVDQFVFDFVSFAKGITNDFESII